ncbi:KfrA N-terminal DNA-binding domain-containing protein [Bordetella tumbae]|uniref:hypothetical protein n=1 Tax=Bordetella tumbae TaxID=1649139 RepID=UPI0039EEB117
MSTSEFEFAALESAVRIIWQECGQTPPVGEELSRAAANLRRALAAGRDIPRVADKTVQPMTGRRHDIEVQAGTGQT